MTNLEYTDDIICSTDRILIDTSTLMTPGFHDFVLLNKKLFLAYGKKIIVSKSVYAELARHLGSANPQKENLALAAVELMVNQQDIFQVENIPVTQGAMQHAFADIELLSDLTLHRTDSSQLLLTNDKKLSCDAFNLNQQQSCYGRKVLVCYINSLGEMHCCDCVHASVNKNVPETIRLSNQDDSVHNDANSTIIHPRPVYNSDSIPSNKTNETWAFDWISSAVSLSGMGLLYVLYKGGKALLHYNKHF